MLNILPVRNDYAEYIDKPIEYLIDNTYSVSGHSTIVSGLLRSGTIKVNDNVAVGPFYDGTYKKCKVRSIHCKIRDIKEARAGKYVCISLKNIQRKEIKKGMVIVSDINSCKIAQKEFWATIQILHSPTTIKIGYQPFVHIDQVRQSIRIMDIIKINKDSDPNIICKYKTEPVISDNYKSETDILKNKTISKKDKYILNTDLEQINKTDEKILRTGDRACVRLEFIGKPEYIKPMMKLIFREGKVRAIGKII